MKRKPIILLALICAAFLFTACAPPAVPVDVTEPDEPAADAPADVSPQPDEVPTSGVTVTMQSVIDEGTVHVFMPVISGLTDTARQDELNAAFAADAQLISQDLSEGTELEYSWRVASSDAQLVSLVNTSYFCAPESAHPWSDCHTFNLDPATGKRVSLSDLCDTAALSALIYGGGCTVLSTGDTDVTDTVTVASILEANAASLPDWDGSYSEATLKALLDGVDVGPGETPLGYSYWENGLVNIVFYYYHAVGDYIVIVPSDPCLIG